MKRSLLNLIILSFLLIFSTGCLRYKDIVNFQDGNKLIPNQSDTIFNNNNLKLKAEDVVQVIITSYNKEEAAKFNLFSGQNGLIQPGASITINDPLGYRIDSKGNIELPVIGQIHVEGMTMEEMRDEVYKLVKETGYLKDLNVIVRFLSFRVTVLGEVNNPGTYVIASQKITILEALGMAKDVNLFCKRNQILVIRETNGKRSYGRINLKSKDVLNSPWYYLQPNDIVYVQPHSAKILAAPDPASRYISTVIAAISLFFLFLK
ncbi:MAG: polysaccharide biosynthesis/export family protein [Bacteroidota bacterium]